MTRQSKQRVSQRTRQRLTPYEHEEERVQRVVKKIRKQQEEEPDLIPNIAQWARNEKVDYQRLERRWRGKVGSLAQRPPTNTRLNKDQTAALIQYCKNRELIGLPIPLKQLADVANSIICRSLSDEDQANFKPVSESWSSRFLSKNRIAVVKSKPIELARKEAYDPNNITK